MQLLKKDKGMVKMAPSEIANYYASWRLNIPSYRENK